MKTVLLLGGLILAQGAPAQGCIQGGRPSEAHYVCFDGRSLDATPTGFVWNAKRGCFVSSVPCCAYDATHYAFYPNSAQIGAAYARCRHDYPFILGQMQTH